MTTRARRWRLAGLLLLAAVGMGCNVLSFPFFLMMGRDPKHDAPCKLASADKNKEVKVVVLAYGGLETRPEFIRIDRELTSHFAKHLNEGCKKNKEKVKLVPIRQVDQFKDEHPNWKAIPPAKIGDHFDADYVIELEVGDITLFEQGSGNQLFRGRALITVRVTDVNEPNEDSKFEKVYRCEYPKTRGPVPVSDGSAAEFRQAFLNHVGRQLSWYFTAHPTSDDYQCD